MHLTVLTMMSLWYTSKMYQILKIYQMVLIQINIDIRKLCQLLIQLLQKKLIYLKSYLPNSEIILTAEQCSYRQAPKLQTSCWIKNSLYLARVKSMEEVSAKRFFQILNFTILIIFYISFIFKRNPLSSIQTSEI